MGVKIYIVAFILLILAALIPIAIRMGAIRVQPPAFLVFDTSSAAGANLGVAKKFRIAPSMRASASGQFSAAGLNSILANIPAVRQNIWIIDLRQESHGFINGLPISWYKNNQNGVNNKKTPQQIMLAEQILLSDLSQQKTVTIYTLKKTGNGEVAAENPITVVPERVETEEELVQSSGVNYQRLYALDHNRPNDLAVDEFVYFVKNTLKPDSWLHFHCRGGKGRASTFMALYAIILQAHTTDLAEVLRQQVALGNIVLDQPSLEADKLWKSDSAKQRHLFLQRFYDYVLAPDGYAVSSWSSWEKAH